MSEENREVSKKEKLYTALTVAEIVVGIVGIALFVVLCRTEEDFHRYIVALLLAIIMIVNGTYGLFKKLNNKKKGRRKKKTVGRKCAFWGGAGEFGEGEKTATEQKKNAEDRPKKNVSRVIVFRTVSFLHVCQVTDAPV